MDEDNGYKILNDTSFEVFNEFQQIKEGIEKLQETITHLETSFKTELNKVRNEIKHVEIRTSTNLKQNKDTILVEEDIIND